MVRVKKNKDEEFVQRNITIPKSQDEYLREKCINLSWFVQKKIKEEKDGNR